MSKLRKFLSLSRSDRRLLLAAFGWLGLVKLGLVFMPFKRVHETIKRFDRPPKRVPKGPVPSVERVVWALDVATRNLPGTILCLPRALAARLLLTRLGYESDLHIGVAKSETGEFEAHAWIEREGTIVVGELEDMDRYRPLSPIEGKPL